MKWKYRILKYGDMYIPQFRWCFIWCSFTEGYSDSRVEFYTQEETHNFLKERIKIRLDNHNRKKEVVKEYSI